VAAIAGNGAAALLIAALLVGFLWRFQPEVWYRNRSLLLFVLALVVSALALRVAADRTLWAFVVPTSATVLLVGLLLGGASGAAIATALAVLAGIMNGNTLAPAVYVLAGGIAALLAIVRAERLNAFVRAGVLVAVTNIGVLTAFSLLQQRDVTAIAQGAGAGAVNAGLSVFLAIGSFALLGNLFGIMTVFQLLELAKSLVASAAPPAPRDSGDIPPQRDGRQPLPNGRRRRSAPIRCWLAWVLTHHDIGKMKNPIAFIENQAGGRNIHDDLTAETSARVIASHVRDGIDLGYEYGLPVQIIGFIPQHHGTSVMSYFHGKALREASGNPELVDQDVFRYPGPKPQSREAAILMLSDGVEAFGALARRQGRTFNPGHGRPHRRRAHRGWAARRC